MIRILGDAISRSKAVLWTSSALAAGQVLSIVNALVTARLLGPSGKGLVTAITSWVQLLSWLSVLGLGTAAQVRIGGLVEDRTTKQDATRVALGNSLAFVCVAGMPVSILSAVVLSRLLGNLGFGASSMTVWAMVMVPLGMLSLVVQAIQVSLGNRRRFNLAQVVNPAVLLVLTVTFVVTSRLTPGKVIVSAIIGSSASLLVAGWGLPWQSLVLSADVFKHDLRFGLKLHLADCLRLTSFRLDILVMSMVLPAAQVGLYGAANSAMMPVLLLASGSSALIAVKVAGMGVGQESAALVAQATAILQEARKYALLSLAVGVLLAGLSPLLVRAVLGPAYGPVVRLIWILMPGYVFLGFSAILVAGAEGMQRPWVGVLGEGAAAAATLGLLPILLPRFGAEGAAMASTGAYGLAACLCALGVARHRKSKNARGKEQVVV